MRDYAPHYFFPKNHFFPQIVRALYDVKQDILTGSVTIGANKAYGQRVSVYGHDSRNSVGQITDKRYIDGKCDYWRKQGVRTASVSLWTRLTKQWFDWERDLYVRNGKCFGVYELGKPE
ncbi:unnamed protein product [Oppiella nova]|uniref:Uncharacterized protein n=1 Tax=Oppiella nova TaxID=334625 RepID=A0A7R9LWB5_9ACAR|nr:unnamed protein product [Oppiella nova]CAG2167630.1 unnamed protein product [Oppiella nova]